MCSNEEKQTLSELILSAVFHLQQKNGVSVMQIAEYIGEKRHCCNPCKLRAPIKIVLTKAKEHGIMSETKGLYRIEGQYEDRLIKEELMPKKEAENEENNESEMDDCVLQKDNPDDIALDGAGQEEDDDEECEDEETEDVYICQDMMEEKEVEEPSPKRRKTNGKGIEFRRAECRSSGQKAQKSQSTSRKANYSHYT